MNPIRMCIVCKNRFEKKDLVRIVKLDGKITVSKNSNQSGKGCYVCKNEECINKLVKQKGLNRVFKTNVLQEDYERIIKQIKEQNWTKE